jgi:crossover junction endodeoxyribonuclease RusA
MATYSYRLPWPPSVNCYIRRGNNRSYMTKKGKEFRTEVEDSMDSIGPRLIGRLAVSIELTPPDKRKRDIDNYIKAALDALQHAAVFSDDSQIDLLRVARCHVKSPGACDVTITEIEP